ncbi:MAG: PRC-barrel domain-containing protein [Candidatus Aenigmatarchaeota archaeon]
MVNIKSFSEVVRKDVFTDKGAYIGKVSDVGLDMDKFRVKSIIVDAVKGSFLTSVIGDKKGVAVPFSVIQSIGDVVLMKHIVPTATEEEQEAN